MRMSWKLGRVAGIDLFLHPSFFILLAFFGASGGLESILLVSAAFGCVLLHELGHALMARGFGIGTEDITLYMIGGVARLRRMPKAPGAELLIALAGPAVNVAIALFLGALLWLGLLGGHGSDLVVHSFAFSLLMINLGLALFNLVPAFPMDGGRIFRALMSGLIGRERATMVAAGLGRGLALAFGFYQLINAPSMGAALMPIALAAFVYMAAGAELAQVLAEGRRTERREDDGVWTAPPGFLWVSRGDGVWQLAPVHAHSSGGSHSPWR
jgi:Zn-dependent protease